MEKFDLKAKTRDIKGKKLAILRKQNLLPAVLYGHDTKNQSLVVNLKEFQKIYQKTGSSALVDLSVDEKPTGKILIHEVQKHPVSEVPLHADFYKIKMTEKIETEIPLEFIGEAPAVKDLEGNLIKNKDHLKIKCLPSNLIAKIEVDISTLATFEDSLHIKDLQIPQGLEILDDPEETVALVEPPRSEEELKAMEEEAVAETEKAGIEKMEAEAEAEKAAKEDEKAAEEGGEKPEGTEKPIETAKPAKEKK